MSDRYNLRRVRAVRVQVRCRDCDCRGCSTCGDGFRGGYIPAGTEEGEP